MEQETTYEQLLAAARKRREQAKKLKGQGLSYAEIGRRLGVSRQRVDQMVNPKERRSGVDRRA